MAIVTAILNTLIVVICIFLICLILIQRGKGGGLAGAFGGAGGSSAFGTKAGDIFTRVTMVVATVWIFLSMILVVLYNQGTQSAWGNDASSSLTREVTPKPKAGTGTTLPGTTPTTPAGAPSSAPAPLPGSGPAAPTSVPAIPPSSTPTPAPAGK